MSILRQRGELQYAKFDYLLRGPKVMVSEGGPAEKCSILAYFCLMGGYLLRGLVNGAEAGAC
jgi:hypothetical protein